MKLCKLYSKFQVQSLIKSYQINFIRIQTQCKSKQSKRCSVKARLLTKLGKSNIFCL